MESQLQKPQKLDGPKPLTERSADSDKAESPETTGDSGEKGVRVIPSITIADDTQPDSLSPTDGTTPSQGDLKADKLAHLGRLSLETVSGSRSPKYEPLNPTYGGFGARRRTGFGGDLRVMGSSGAGSAFPGANPHKSSVSGAPGRRESFIYRGLDGTAYPGGYFPQTSPSRKGSSGKNSLAESTTTDFHPALM